MPVTVIEQENGRVLAVKIRGKLAKPDYDRFAPEIERLIERHGKISFLVEFEDFTGIEPGALWQDLKFEVKHFNDVERVAVVGEQRWMEWMTRFCKPFTTAEVRYFQPDRRREALDWVSAPVEAKA